MFGRFVEQGREQVAFGYYLGAGLMIAAGLVALVLAVNAERRSLEDIAMPLTAQDAMHDDRIPGRGEDTQGDRAARVGSGSPGSSAAARTAIDLDATERERTRG